MKSMTGYAKKQCIVNGRNYIVEIKTLNSKQIDTAVKIPQSLKEHEMEIRSMLNKLVRGKIDCTISEENVSAAAAAAFDHDTATKRIVTLKEYSAAISGKIAEATLLEIVLRQSDLWSNGATENTLSDDEWEQLKNAIDDTIYDVDKTRSDEGYYLEQDFNEHVDLIEEYLKEIPQYEQERITTAKERMHSYLADAAIKEIDTNRFEQELIYYLEKLDITEEKVRLAKHIKYFREVMDEEENCGKKLGFIAQEMGREINTTGSKANHVEIQRLVVAMKDELEKIKEQLGNIL